MLKEQRRLLDWARPLLYNKETTNRSVLNQLVVELVKAVREDCAKVVEDWPIETPYGIGNIQGKEKSGIVAAIRGRK